MSTSQRGDLQNIKALLQQRIDDLVQALVPEGHRFGRYWIGKNPARADTRAGSFWIIIDARDAGVWKDEAVMEKAADVIELVRVMKGLPDTSAALAWARGWLSLSPRAEPRPGEARLRRDQPCARGAPSDRTRQEERIAELKVNRARAFGLWINASPDLEGTAADRYLKSRGIDISSLGRPPRALRFLRKHDHIAIDGEVTTWPCLIAKIEHPETGECLAVHRTWLLDHIGGKAPVTPARKIWPSFAGGVIKLARGETGLAVKAAIDKGESDRLAIVEGIEDGLSLALACPGLRVWAAGSLGNIANVKVPACASEVIVFADNDWGKPQAQQLLMKGVGALAAQGIPVKIARSHVGKDVNDALCAGSGQSAVGSRQ